MHLIIAEKNIAAKRIASILAPKKPKQSRVNGVDTYQFKNKEETVVIGLSGHIVTVDFPPQYKNWQKVESRELIDAEIVTVATHSKIVSVLKKMAKKATNVTIATDYDREGELIGVEALNILKKANPDLKFDRVRYSAITPKEINDAFSNPVSIDFNLAAAGHSRQVIDLVWGASLTRYLSLVSGRLGNMFLSVGRVQSPTLAIIVDREKERDEFVPKPYWEIDALLEDKNKNEVLASHSKGRFWDKDEADTVMEKVNKARKAVVSQIRKSSKTDKPPTPFNTTELISAASSIGFTASNAMRIAESLYTNGYISYPRTDNTVYPASLDLRAQIEIFSSGIFKEYANELLKKKELIPTRGKKESTDHPPIYPASYAKKSELNEQEWKLYELVVRRFFATFAEPARWETMRIKFEINEEEFKSSGARLVNAGWRWYYPYNAPEDRLLPQMEEKDILSVEKIDMVDKETKPPGRYGQGRLIRLMEELGLGTKATRHETISKLYSRTYVHGSPLIPTKTAYAVIETLEKYAPTITKPDMTSKLEQDMDKIAEGEITENDVIDESREMLQSIFSEFEKCQDKIAESLRAGLREDKIVGSCPECNSKLSIRRSRRGSRFIGCSNYPDCTFSLPLPKSGQIIVTDKSCDEHGLYHLRIISKGRRPWNLGCPQCNFLEWQKSQNNENQEKNEKVTSKNAHKKTVPASKKKSDKVTEISGIGKVTAEKLDEAGIVKIGDLLNADATEISRKTNISVKKIKNWQKIAVPDRQN
ncbi:DNA topoisomerase I [Methanosalsum zhilinae DSM 4017]|uniref:DNA topoisomerase 1 n=1 Tax=Methanosalsum zhilinae (strain DSM 4017 / NBRC 107636 / OCM 62 / WeN5) TaxID=679901 RepID=F7XKA0_METZD|nr:DNA topoisomerase I [Methanosalsum zhilinae]AEH60567.1 DNA topoisomerase I [Methanosalsum zhilinae DSM 4017]